MKFAKELDQDLVPEWRAKYLNYKLGKKKVNAVGRALEKANQAPKTPGRRRPANLFVGQSYQLPAQIQSPFEGSTLLTSRASGQTPLNEPKNVSRYSKTTSGYSHTATSSGAGPSSTSNVKTPRTLAERRPLRKEEEDTGSPWESGVVTNYGSIVASPPYRATQLVPPMLELPGPALPPEEESFPRHNRAWRHSKSAHESTPVRRATSAAGEAYEVGRSYTPSKLSASFLPQNHKAPAPKRSLSTPDGRKVRRSPFLHRVLSVSSTESPDSPDIPLEAFKVLDERQADYFAFLDKELDKIEDFYRKKEQEATNRLQILRQQLHTMRDRRVEEMLVIRHAKEQALHETKRSYSAEGNDNGQDSVGADAKIEIAGRRWIKPIEQVMEIGSQRFGKNSQLFEQMFTPSGPVALQLSGQRQDSWRDFTRRSIRPDEVPYRTAKGKLKRALQEYYRGLELLKSYALLNRTAFRKINKKYDKAVKARPTGRYMSEVVNKAWFVQSEVLDGHIVAVEDLYARYFERGNHKIAVGKLRSKHIRDEMYNGSVFRNGLLMAAGLVFGIQGIIYGAEHLADPDPTIQTNTSYLLQIYGGYFLALFLFLLFCLDCKVWVQAKINYVFIFEFDTRHHLDWRQLSELPCFLLFVLGITMWLNFQHSGTDVMYLYWPIVLLGLTTTTLFFPGPIIYHRSREWWAYANFRLLFAGWYPVEFRDFFLGDMYCSQTYAMGNIELFFCLYTHGWREPAQCNSSSSYILGILTTLPGLWRALQCLRRYYDTRNAFPHLVNCGKYTFTILFYLSLCLYRIHYPNFSLRAIFIFCATVNSVYSSIWDLAMDWSLCNPYAKHPFLRDVLGYKRAWMYYLAMIIDPILRFNWIFYAIFADELQHSALLSFFVGFSEICRRAIWTLFRVENEHCTNVRRFKASRDIPLPYDVPSAENSHTGDESPPEPHSPDQKQKGKLHEPLQPHYTSSADLERASASGSLPPSGFLRRRRPQATPESPMARGIARVGTIMSQAHQQDFERKRRPGVSGEDEDNKQQLEEASSDEDEDDVETAQDIMASQQILDRHPSVTDTQ